MHQDKFKNKARKFIKSKYKTLSKGADALGLTIHNLSMSLSLVSTKPVSPKILEDMGWKRVTLHTYEEANKDV